MVLQFSPRMRYQDIIVTQKTAKSTEHSPNRQEVTKPCHIVLDDALRLVIASHFCHAQMHRQLRSQFFNQLFGLLVLWLLQGFKESYSLSKRVLNYTYISYQDQLIDYQLPKLVTIYTLDS